MNKTINLHKMKALLDSDNNARYELDYISINDLIGKNLKIEFLNEINCVSCGIKTKKRLFSRLLLYVYEEATRV